MTKGEAIRIVTNYMVNNSTVAPNYNETVALDIVLRLAKANHKIATGG